MNHKPTIFKKYYKMEYYKLLALTIAKNKIKILQ